MKTRKLFPIQSERGAQAHPTRIPWSVADKAYSVYRADNGNGQSLQRLAERGGFCPSEIDLLFPRWREESDEIGELRRNIATLSDQVVVGDKTIEMIVSQRDDFLAHRDRLSRELARVEEAFVVSEAERDALRAALLEQGMMERRVLSEAPFWCLCVPHRANRPGVPHTARCLRAQRALGMTP